MLACVARRYTKRRVLGVDLCRCFDNFKIKFALDFDCDESEHQAAAILGEFMRVTDTAIAYDRNETVTYEAIPMELEIEVAGVKERF